MGDVVATQESSPEDPLRHAWWITTRQWQREPSGPLPVLAAVLRIPSPVVRAELTVAGLGVHRTTVDGLEVGRGVLAPGYSDYARWTEYETYDVQRLLTPGEHVLAVALGPGMYRSQPEHGRWTKVRTDYGDLAARVRLRWVEAGGQQHELLSDESWSAALGAHRSSNWVGGEDYDARLEPDQDPAAVRRWPRAVVARVPPGLEVRVRTGPPVVRHEVVPAREVREQEPGVLVVDLGRNLAGWPELDLPPRTSVVVRPAELLHPDGRINPDTQGWGPVHHTVRTGEEAITWHPRFMYNGFRYLEVRAQTPLALAPAQVRGVVLGAEVEQSGRFTCSDRRLEDIHALVVAAIRANTFSVLTDCPQREKLLYLEQLHLVHDVLVQNFDLATVLRHCLTLIREAQGPDGHLPLYVPEWEPFPEPWRGDANWGLCAVFLPWQLYRDSGDVTVLLDNQACARRYLHHLLDSRDDSGLLRHGLGDWDGQRPGHVPLVTTGALVRALRVMADGTAVTGGDPRPWRDEADRVLADLRSAQLGTDGAVGTGTAAELAIALHCGVVPPDQVTSAVDRLEALFLADLDLMTFGEVGVVALVQVLSEHDRHATLLALTRVVDRPGYGYQLLHGATTLTETWDGPTFGISQNHFMNGAIDHWFFAHVAGLRRAPGDIGLTDLLVRPRVCGDLTAAGARRMTPGGEYAASWALEDHRFRLDVTIPTGASAEVELPDGSTVSGVRGRRRFQVPWEPVAPQVPGPTTPPRARRGRAQGPAWFTPS